MKDDVPLESPLPENPAIESLGRFISPFLQENEQPETNFLDGDHLSAAPKIFKEVWKNGYVPPSRLFKKAARKYLDEINASQNSKYGTICRQLADSIGFFDTNTGYEKPETKELNLELLRQFKKTEEKPQQSFYITGDISNLRGLNYALSGLNITKAVQSEIKEEGAKTADLFINIVAKELALAFAKEGGVCEFYRDGGDEFSVIAHGISESQVRSAIETAEDAVTKVAQAAGLDKIVHAKYPKDPKRKGLSFKCDYTEISDGFDLARTQGELEQSISDKKAAAGDMHEAVDSLSGDQIQVAALVLHNHLDDIERKFKPYTAKTPPWRWDTRRIFPFSDRKIKLPWEKLTSEEKELMGISPLFLTNSTIRMMQAREALEETQGWSHLGHFTEVKDSMEGASAIPDSERERLRREKFFERLYHIYEKAESITGLKNNHFLDDLKLAVALSADKKAGFDAGFRVLFVDIQNTSGMNAELGSLECNKHIAGIAKEVWSILTMHRGYRPYRAAGASGQRLFCLIPGDTDINMNETAYEINKAVSDYIKDQDKEYAGGGANLSDLPNPRHPTSAYKGVRVVMAAGEVTKETIIPFYTKGIDAARHIRKGDAVEKGGEVAIEYAARFAAEHMLEEMDARIENNIARRKVWNEGGRTIGFNRTALRTLKGAAQGHGDGINF